MLDNLSYNQFWAIFYNLSILILVVAFIWLFNPQRKYYLKKLEKEKNKTKNSTINKKNKISNSNNKYNHRFLTICTLIVLFLLPILFYTSLELIFETSLSIKIISSVIFIVILIIILIFNKFKEMLLSVVDSRSINTYENVLTGFLTAVLVLYLNSILNPPNNGETYYNIIIFSIFYLIFFSVLSFFIYSNITKEEDKK